MTAAELDAEHAADLADAADAHTAERMRDAFTQSRGDTVGQCEGGRQITPIVFDRCQGDADCRACAHCKACCKCRNGG